VVAARLIVLACLGLAACGQRPAPVATVDYCAAFRPIIPSVTDWKTMSAALARAIKAHDDTGERLCGWTPNGRAPGQ
jgi:hypothetical protein